MVIFHTYVSLPDGEYCTLFIWLLGLGRSWPACLWTMPSWWKLGASSRRRWTSAFFLWCVKPQRSRQFKEYSGFWPTNGDVVCIWWMVIYGHIWLLVSNGFYFPFHIGCHPNHIDELIFFRGVGQPPSWYGWLAITLWSKARLAGKMVPFCKVRWCPPLKWPG